MVLHCDDATSGGPGVVSDGLGVQGFDGEWVNHADVNSFYGDGGGGERWRMHLSPTDSSHERLYTLMLT